MHRQRKKDFNLKPNRVLDKRSSRGVMYENEELRLRTLAIADDVDRGHSELKKLRKENDSLKREMWSLRDECDKLEAILKKAHPDLLLLRNSEEFQGEDDEEEDDEDFGEDEEMFMMMDDQEEDHESRSIIDGQHGATGDVSSSGGFQQQQHQQGPSSPPGVTWSADVLEGIREESESLFNAQEEEDDSIEQIVLPDPGDFFGSEPSSPESPPAPMIQITPASSSPVSPAMNQKEDNEDRSTNDKDKPSNNEFICEEIILDGAIQDGGCVTLLPKLYQVTSEIHIDPPTAPSPPNNNQNQSACSAPGLPPQSPSTSSKNGRAAGRSSVKGSNKVDGQKESQGNDTSNNKVLWRRDSLKTNGSPMGFCGGNRGLPPFGGSVGFVVPSSPCCPSCSNVLHSLTYNSEPSLVSPENSFVGFESFCAAAASHPGRLPSWLCSPWNNLPDKNNLAIGYLSLSSTSSENDNNNEEQRVKPQEIIDELERQFDPTLEKVRGLRVLLPSRIFVSLKDASSLKALVDKFGAKGTSEFWVKNSYKVVFVDASDRRVIVTLSGIPPETTDAAVVSQLNQFGEVVGGVERRKYKGVDIAERLVEMVVVDASLPPSLNVGGCQVAVTSTRLSGNETSVKNVSKGHMSPSINVTNNSLVKASNTQSTRRNKSGDEGMVNEDPGISSSTSHRTVNSLSSPQSHLLPTKMTGPGEISTSSPSSLKPHKPVTRSTSSNPRLETSNIKPPSPVLVSKRLASICGENLASEAHPSKLISSSHTTGQQQPNSSSSAPNLIPPPGKKPLSRLLRSSPGSLVPPTMTGKAVTVLSNETPGDNTPSHQNEAGTKEPTTSGGLRAAFYRTFSHDRRPSATSQTGEHNNNNTTHGTPGNKIQQHQDGIHPHQFGGSPRRRSSGGYVPGGQGRHPSHSILMQMNSSSSSGGGRDRGRGNRFGSLHSSGGPKEPLPWCGCWGNGCV